MAKRLTDTAKWQDPWFMDLPAKYKLFWVYILDTCDHAGIWKVNFKVASFYVGEHLEPSEVRRVLSSRIKELNDNYWAISKFIDFQYGGIKNDSVGKSVQKILQKHGLEAPTKPLDSPYEVTKDIDKDIVIVKDINTLEEFKACIDELYLEQLKMAHKGKDVDLAINQAFLHVSAKNEKIDAAGVKKLVNTWLSNMRPEKGKERKNPYGLH